MMKLDVLVLKSACIDSFLLIDIAVALLDHFKKFQNFKSSLVVADDVKIGNLGG
jgi:hypothetical protein